MANAPPVSPRERIRWHYGVPDELIDAFAREVQSRAPTPPLDIGIILADHGMKPSTEPANDVRDNAR